MPEEQLTLQEQKLRDHAFAMFYAVCGYAPSDEISEFLKKDEDASPKEQTT